VVPAKIRGQFQNWEELEVAGYSVGKSQTEVGLNCTSRGSRIQDDKGA
jgi:hypothetical protein